ncbi:hypothetical protein Tco_0812800 [Tanacetum coccineum]
MKLPKICVNFKKKHKLQDKTTQDLSSRVFTLENYDPYSKIDNYVNETVKEVVHNALQAPIHHILSIQLSTTLMRYLWIVKTGKSSLKQRPSLIRDAVINKILLHLLQKDSDQSKKKRHDSDASASKQPPVQNPLAWKTYDIREAPSNSSKQKTAPQSEQPVDDVPIPDDMHILDSEDTGVAHLLKIKTRPDWLKPVPEEETPKTPEPEWVIPPNDLLETENNRADALAKTYKDPEENKMSTWSAERGLLSRLRARGICTSLESKRDYDISAAYGISHWWFKRKEFYITRHSAPSDRSAVRSHMRILSVVNLQTFSRYGYTYLKEIVLRRADYKEYKISEADFKNMHLNDFEDLYLLHLQGKLNHLSGADKVHLFNAVNLWIRNIVIR